MTRLTVAEIEAMDRVALPAAWEQCFKSPVPKGLSKPFLRRFLAFEVQSRRIGSLPKGFLKTLDRQVFGGTSSDGAGPLPGGRLLREWNGVTHAVDVRDDGYRWNGKTYRSLSAVARAITGARWSGPRFFGIGGRER